MSDKAAGRTNEFFCPMRAANLPCARSDKCRLFHGVRREIGNILISNKVKTMIMASDNRYRGYKLASIGVEMRWSLMQMRLRRFIAKRQTSLAGPLNSTLLWRAAGPVTSGAHSGVPGASK